MEETKKVEVLAPAGSYESMVAAFAAGADAVYIGGSRFGARAYAENLDEDRMCRAIDYAHLHGRRIYMTINTLLKEGELKELYGYLLPFYRQGLDAVIVQDLGAMALIRDRFPDLPIHASTQMTITGVYGAKKAKALGASRIVTARELSLEEIRRIRSQVNIEIECFVHGALCYCYSGQCLMSSLIGGRSGNRGRCAQPCRLPYEVKREGRTINGKGERYVLSMKDLCTLDLLPELIKAGIDSLKIEGRMKSPRYTAGVVNMYRKYIDLYWKEGSKGYQVLPEDKKLLLDLFDRGGFTQGYYKQHNGKDMAALKEKPVFREENRKYAAYLDENYVGHSLKEPIEGEIVLEPGKEAKLTLKAFVPPVSVTCFGAVAEEASNQPITKEKLEKQLKKTGDTPFFFQNLDIWLSGACFLPLQAINELRRRGLKSLEETILSLNWRSQETEKERREEKDGERKKECGWNETKKTQRPLMAVSIEEQEQLGPLLNHRDVDVIYVDANGFLAGSWKDTVKCCHKAGKQCCLTMPHIFRQKADEYFRTNWEMMMEAGFDGIVVRNLEECQWLEEMEALEFLKSGSQNPKKALPKIFDGSLYAWNHLADQTMLHLGAERITMPVELNARDLKEKGCQGQELLVYGALPMMISAQCIKKTTGCCDHKPEVVKLKDRTGKEMPVKNHCNFCSSTIYNASPLSLLGLEDLIGKLNPGVIRLQFTTESPKEITECLDAFAAGFFHGKKEIKLTGEFTRGHIRRGAE